MVNQINITLICKKGRENFMKTTEEFEVLLKQLLDGTIQELVVEQAEYFNFREAWLKLPNRNDVIGEAGLNGRIIYRIKK